MGCASSSIEREESVRRCRERRRLMKQVVQYRNEFAVSQVAYLHSLKNTGATLRQFAEVESSELGTVNAAPFRVAFPPPPPPPLSPSNTHFTAPAEELGGYDQNDKPLQENIEIDEPGNHTPPPPSAHGSSWEFWDPFAPASPSQLRKTDDCQQVEDEDWAETNTEFEDEEEELEADLVSKVVPQKSTVNEIDYLVPKSVVEKSSARETDYWVSKVVHDKSPAREIDDNSSMVSWYTKDSDMTMVVWKTKKSLTGIVKDLDDYFLKASAGGKEISILMENNRGTSLLQNFIETKKKSCKSAKVFSTLSWNRSSKSLQSSRDSFEFQTMDEAYRPSSLSETLDKLYVEEQKLYEEVKGEEIAKRQHEKEVHLLQRQEAKNQEGVKVDKTRVSVERSRSQINSLKVSIATTFSTIVRLRDEELHPQLVELSGGLTRMWRIMYECHQVQNHISQQLNNLNDQLSTEATTEYHRLATIQLETEVAALYASFCNLLKSQRDYMRMLNAWIKLTNCLTDGDGERNDFMDTGAFALCDQWRLALERLPDKVTSEAIKSFIAVIHSIAVQQAEEHRLRRKLERLEKRLDKELKSLSLMKRKYGIDAEFISSMNVKHPLCVKRAKTDAFKKRVDEQRSKYHSAVQVTRAMMLNNLQTGLPNVFQALTGFSSVSMQAFEGLYNQSKGVPDDNRSGCL